MGNGFRTFATKTSVWIGSRWPFLGAIFIIVAWAVLGPYFHYSNTWQLIVKHSNQLHGVWGSSRSFVVGCSGSE